MKGILQLSDSWWNWCKKWHINVIVGNGWLREQQERRQMQVGYSLDVLKAGVGVAFSGGLRVVIAAGV